jgi:hypothetical protein
MTFPHMHIMYFDLIYPTPNHTPLFSVSPTPGPSLPHSSSFRFMSFTSFVSIYASRFCIWKKTDFSFWVCPILLNIMVSMSTLFPANDMILFFFVAEVNVYICYVFLSFWDRCLLSSRLASNSRSYLSLLSAGITGVCHHTWLELPFCYLFYSHSPRVYNVLFIFA